MPLVNDSMVLVCCQRTGELLHGMKVLVSVDLMSGQVVISKTMPIDYRETLNLPRTDFPMKANLGQREPEMLRFWEEKDIYRKLQEQNRPNKHYILHDGPPYANGNIHIGHALNKILKDIIVKYKAMQGHYAPYVPGWDCHGLPIELQVDKNLGDKKDGFDVLQKRQLCREYAAKYVDIQREEFRRLGVFGDWMNPYLTMSYAYEASIVREFFRFVKRGSVYKGKKPVHWCPSCVTALAEAEVEYNDKESPSVFVAFPVTAADAVRLVPDAAGKEVAIVIWTTTPWTLPANLALAVHAELTYVAIAHGDRIIIVAEDNIESLRDKIGLSGEVLVRLAGRIWKGLLRAIRLSIASRESSLENFVTTGEGAALSKSLRDMVKTTMRRGFSTGSTSMRRSTITASLPRKFLSLRDSSSSRQMRALSRCCRKRSIARHEYHSPLVSSLLALQETGYIPRDCAVVHLDGRQTISATKASPRFRRPPGFRRGAASALPTWL